ncbi:MAG TPA: type II toxin-antitoxin system RelE/ParE family toxin [Caulobacteraceae bacterium]
MKLRWSRHAFDDRIAIFDYIKADSPRAAMAIDERIDARAEGLSDFPESGRPGRAIGTRELVVTGTPYIIIYQLTADAVRILRIVHGARRWPDDEDA